MTMTGDTSCAGEIVSATAVLPTTCVSAPATGGPAGAAGVRAVCTASGTQLWGYASEACAGSPMYVMDGAQLLGEGAPTLDSCSALGSAGGLKISCYGTREAALPAGAQGGAAAPAIATCRGSTAATTPASPTIACYEGVMFDVRNASLADRTRVQLAANAPYAFCASVTAECKVPSACAGLPRGSTMRVFMGLDTCVHLACTPPPLTPLQAPKRASRPPHPPPPLSTRSTDITQLAASAAYAFDNARDLTVCTTAGCNNPFSDACKVGGFSSLSCGGAPPTLPDAPANDIKCYDGRDAQASATAGNKFCVAFSTFCGNGAARAAGWANPFCPAVDGAAVPYPLNGTLRARFPKAKLATILSALSATNISATPAGFQAALALFAPGASLTTSAFGPGFPLRKLVNDLVICSTENCNGGAADQCAPAERPTRHDIKFAGIPDAQMATDASGKKSLIPAAVEVLRASIETAVQASACATCSVTLTRVVEDATGNALYEAPADAAAAARRLQAGTSVTTTFATSGGSAAQLAAVDAAATSPAFSATVTSAVAANPGYSGVTASAAITPAKVAAALGLLGLLALLILVPIVYCICKKKAAAAAAAKTAPAGALVINAPPGSTVIIQQGGGNGGTAV